MAKRRFSPTYITSSAGKKLSWATRLAPDFASSEVSTGFGALVSTAFCAPAALGFTAATSAAAFSLTSHFGAGTNDGNSSIAAAGLLLFAAITAVFGAGAALFGPVFATAAGLFCAVATGFCTAAVLFGTGAGAGFVVAVVLLTACDGFMLISFSAAVLGSAALREGLFHIIGTLLGVLTVAVGNNGLAMIGAPIFTQFLFAGCLLVLAVALGGIGRRYGRG